MARATNPAPTTTFLFTDIEGSTRLWEREPERMRVALAGHDALCREAVAAHHGRIVKGTGDGIHAVFDDPLDGVQAALHLQQALQRAEADATAGGALALRVRSGLHCGVVERRDGDFYGSAVNRAARIMAIGHGGQTLLSQAVAERVASRLPADVALQDLGRVRLRDLSSPEQVHQLLHPALRADFPPVRSLEATPNNLAQQLDSFIGRERELAEVKALLGRSRLVTLLGMGGIGKSRLSVQLGADRLDEHPDGVWLVELAPLTDPRLVPQALANVLGVKEQPGQPVLDALLDHVRDKVLLVILDNCEHLVRACAELAKQLLQAGAGLQVLASSRDVLQVAGETVYAVPTLSVPDAHQPADIALLTQHAAVQLFVDRATAAQSAFRLHADNAAAVAQICQRLDGIPLALELAAARTRSLSVQAIAARLDDRFRLLVTGDQTVLPRQRTLRALIDWSFDLLGPGERVLFRRLAVFAGGWTLEAAEAVCAGDGLDLPDVLDLLAQLVGKSLVVMEPGGGRYRMLETVRAYAQEQLALAGDEADTRRRHVAHHLGLADAARSALMGPEQARWLALLDLERENLLAAHDGCGRDPSLVEQGLQLVFVLKGYWHARGLLTLGHQVTVEALQRTPADARTFGRCRALCDAGQLSYFLGRYAEARRYLEDSHAIARQIGDAGRMAAVLQPLGMVHMALGDTASARATYEAALPLAQQLGHQRLVAASLNALAQLHRADGALDSAEALYARTLELARDLGDRESEAIAMLNRAMLALLRQQVPEAARWLRDVQQISQDIASAPVQQSLLDVAAGLCAVGGDWPRCAQLFGAAQALALTSGIRRQSEDEAFLQPLVDRASAALGARGFEQAEREGRQLDAPQRALVLQQALQAGPAAA
jgi:predicted ATPase/class 3 adenylate cyclase